MFEVVSRGFASQTAKPTEKQVKVQSIHMASSKLQKKLFAVAKRISNKILVELKFLHQIIFGRLRKHYTMVW